ncbi:hypothetical protein DB30_07454 [Enhygromyxa salina]|uniref:Uncharacterized protein n=1 Tax=Enhygromyxa salina TaxID=215803 RepID=A0A0C2CRU0_9BACT|nr:hypothetical protein DB30_07454 [Enhygromyxa salina]
MGLDLSFMPTSPNLPSHPRPASENYAGPDQSIMQIFRAARL